MVVDILKHELVPPHEILSKQDAKNLLDSLGVTKDQFPLIPSTDPVVKAINAQKGDIIKITRNSPTAGQSLYYRVVM
ncbi:MAG: DNA-directed RNA polymerase subunit H [Candidatus Aenigmarchaeota archaeon]|nr:DNA-directed RNA polymerase subunit H [Candidatus Aenigmarchaeota archaeon]